MSSPSNAIAARRKTLLEVRLNESPVLTSQVRGKLKQLGTVSRLHELDLSNYLRRLQDETVENLRITLDAEASGGAEKLTGDD